MLGAPMVDKIQSLLGPDGSPSDPGVDIVGAPRSAPASPESPVKKPIPGPLAWSDDVLLAVTRALGFPEEFPEPTPEEKAEAQWEDKVIEAIESGAITRKKPGRILGTQDDRRPEYHALALECLQNNPGNRKLAKDEFIPRAEAKFNVTFGVARKRWYEMLKDIFTDQ